MKTQEQNILYLVKKVTRLSEIIHKYQSEPRDYGTGDKLHMREAHFIDCVGLSGADMGTLAQKLEVSNGAVSQTAARLEKKGYVYRQAKAEDSRSICCFLTEKGQRIYEYHRRVDEEKYPRFYRELADYTEQDLCLCSDFIERMIKLYEEERK